MSEWDAFPLAGKTPDAPSPADAAWDAFPTVGKVTESGDIRPKIDSPEYVDYIAKKHKIAPAFAKGLVQSQTASSAVEGIPILGGLAHQAGAGASALAQPFTGAGASGGSIGERYTKNKAIEDEIANDFATEHPHLKLASELIGGTAATLPVAGTALGARALGLTGRTLPAQIAAGAASGAGINAADAVVRGNDPFTSAGIGAALGGVAQPAARLVGHIAQPVVSNIAARINPRSYAESQLARGIAESGLTADEIANRVAQAAHEGQGEFTVADAMGNPGQRLLSTVTRGPGEGRTEAVNFLDQRQAGQGRRVANTLAEGFGAPETAAQTEGRLTAERTTEANRNYGAARGVAGAVDVTPVISRIDETLAPGATRVVNPNSAIADDSIEALMRRARGMLTDDRSQISRFDEAFRVKQEIDNMIDRAPSTAQRLLIPVRNALDDQLARSSALYRQARDRFREQSQAIEAVGLGGNAARRGRVENTVPQFLGMGNAERDAFRSGYVDPLIEQTQSAGVGANKARPFTSDAFRTEGQIMAPQQGGNQMMRRIARENTMFETRNAAMGGSKTADNLADSAAMAHAPTLAAHILSGNIGGLARSSFGMLANAISGNTPAVRQEAARLLMMRGGNITARDLTEILSSAVQQVRARDQFLRRVTGLTARVGANQISHRTQ